MQELLRYNIIQSMRREQGADAAVRQALVVEESVVFHHIKRRRPPPGALVGN